MSPDQQFFEFLRSQPVTFPADLALDGKVHRFGDGEKGREPGWYVGTREGNCISFTYGSHKDPSAKTTFKSKRLGIWRPNSTLADKWESCRSNGTTPYLQRKKIGDLFGARINHDTQLVLPLYKDGALVGLQTISEDGKKLFVKGSKKKGAYFELMAKPSIEDVIFVCEGFATAASVCMAMDARTVCAFDSGNLPLVVNELKLHYPNAQLVVAGDDDRFGGQNSGRIAAQKVAKVSRAAFPSFKDHTHEPTDWNDLHCQEGLDEVRSQIRLTLESAVSENGTAHTVETIDEPTADVVSGHQIEDAEPPAKENFVLPGLLRGHVGLLVSPGGVGKSGVALLIANQIASGGKKDFLGFGEVEGGAACIVTLEDPLSIFSKRQREVKKDLSEAEYENIDQNLHLIDATKKQNMMTADFIIGSLQKACKKKSSDLTNIRLVIIDHLTYWSAKDLNDGRVCSEIIMEFGEIAQRLNCAVLVLHHANRSAMVKGKDRPAPSSTIGGSYKLHSLTRWVSILDDVSTNDLRNEWKQEGEPDSFKELIVDKVNHGDKLRLLLTHKKERSGILYRHSFECRIQPKQETANGVIVIEEKEFGHTVFPTEPVGGLSKRKNIASIPAAMVKTQGIFGSFANYQVRPKLEAYFELGDGRSVKMLGHSMFNGFDARVLAVLLYKASQSGRRLLLKNYAEEYSQIQTDSAEEAVPSFRLETTFHEICKELGISAPGKRQYLSVRRTLESFSTCQLFLKTKSTYSSLSLVSFAVHLETGKLMIHVNPFTTMAIMGLAHFSVLDLDIVRTIESDTAYILYQALCSRIREGEAVPFNAQTLMDYIWPTPSTPSNIKDRRKSLSSALDCLQHTAKDWSFIKTDPGKWQIRRSGLSV